MTRARDGQTGCGWWLALFAVVTTVALFLVVLLGFVDTATGSALGCGRSFPLCHGSFLPGQTVQSLIEWSHRSLAAIAGILVAVLAGWTWVRCWHWVAARVLAFIAILFVVIESVVGALAVLSPESEAVIAVHLGIALTAFAATALLTQLLWQVRGGAGLPRRGAPPREMSVWAWVMLVFMYLALYLGAYVAATESGKACLTWPLCPGGHPTLSLANPVTIDLVHRGAALLAAGLAFQLFAVARRTRAARPDLARLAHAILGLVALQIASGLLVVETRIALGATLIHVGLATVLFTTVAALAFGTLPASAGPR